MKTLRVLTWAPLVFLALFGATACDSSEITYVTVEVTDTVHVDKLTWVGAQVVWAGEVLNNDVQVHADNGWECTEVFEMPYWLPMDPGQTGEATTYTLTMVEFYICTATDAVAAYESGLGRQPSVGIGSLSYSTMNLRPNAPRPEFRRFPAGARGG